MAPVYFLCPHPQMHLRFPSLSFLFFLVPALSILFWADVVDPNMPSVYPSAPCLTPFDYRSKSSFIFAAVSSGLATEWPIVRGST